MKLVDFPALLGPKLRMIWRVSGPCPPGYLIGTAHFFPVNYAPAFFRLFKNVHLVAFEGPLDPESMETVVQYGHQPDGGPQLQEILSSEIISRVEARLRMDLMDSGVFAYPSPQAKPVYFDLLSSGVRPWMAFFNIWQTCLGWNHSLDMDAYQLACRLGISICFLETIAEQLQVLDNIPMERICQQLADIYSWRKYARRYHRAFSRGDLDSLLALSGRFPTRSPAVINTRDRNLTERLIACYQQGPTAGFVGAPHIPGVRQGLESAGFRVEQTVI